MNAPLDDEAFKRFSEHLRDTGKSRPEDALEGFKEKWAVPEGFLGRWYDWQAIGLEGSKLAKRGTGETESELYQRLRDQIFTKTAEMRREEPSKLLVFGSVQSGKTRAYTTLLREFVEGVANHAPGPKKAVVIVLTGVHEKLRSQTYGRLKADLSDLDGKVAFPCGDADVGGRLHENIRKALEDKPTALVFTVKKVASRLDTLEKLFDDKNMTAALKDHLILIIDDECDQVSTDMARKPKKNAHRVGSLVWNASIRNRTAGVCYIGFSATPFANIMLSNERGNSLFPSDGILNLPTGNGYMGPKHYFRQEGNFDVVTIPDLEANGWKAARKRNLKLSIDLDSSLADSVLWFGCAAFHKRSSSEVQTLHTTAMIHAYTQVADHRRLHAAVVQLIKDLCDMADEELRTRLLAMLSKTTGDSFSPAPEGLTMRRRSPRPIRRFSPAPEGLTREDVRAIRSILKKAAVIQDHSKSEERLDYTGDGPKEIIVIGGHTLSRGLTLEGLVSSYFVRTGDFAYDTFLQFCRWYGYRGGYQHLTRVWLTGTDARDFAKIAECEQDLRDQIKDASDRSRRETFDLPGEVTFLIDQEIGRLPSKTLDAAQMFGAQIAAGSPVPTRFFDRDAPRWTDDQVRDLLPEMTAGNGPLIRFCAHAEHVIDFLKKEGRSDHPLFDRIQLALEEDAEWDVLLAGVQTGSSSQTFTCRGTVLRRARHNGRMLGARAYVKDFTSKDWRNTHEGRPLLIVSPIEVGPDEGSWNDIAVAIVLPEDVTVTRMRNSSLIPSLEDIEDLETDQEEA